MKIIFFNYYSKKDKNAIWTQSETDNDQAGLKFNAEEFTSNKAPLPSQLVDVNCITSA